MSAFFEIMFESVKNFSAEIIAGLLFAFCMWKFPKLRSLITRYKNNQSQKSDAERGEILAKLQDIQSQLAAIKLQQESSQREINQEKLEEELRETQEQLEQEHEQNQEQEQKSDDMPGLGWGFIAGIALLWFTWSWGRIIQVIFYTAMFLFMGYLTNTRFQKTSNFLVGVLLIPIGYVTLWFVYAIIRFLWSLI